MDGFISTIKVEYNSTTLNVLTAPVRPLGRIEGDPESVLAGLYVIGRSLARLHSSMRLSHNNICESSILVSERTGAWMLSDELASDMKGNFTDLLHRITPMLDDTNMPPEFMGPSTLIAAVVYPVHARDVYSYAKLVSSLAARFHLPMSNSVRGSLESMTEKDYTKRPTLDNFLKSDFFGSSSAIKIIGQLIDLRNGLLTSEAATRLYTELPSSLAALKNQKVLRMVADNLTKLSVLVHPAASSTKFLASFLSIKSETPSSTTASESATTGLFALEDYRDIVLPFIGELWSVERPGSISILLKYISKYVYRLNPDFVSAVIVPRIVGLNILLEPGVPQLYIYALPVLVKALLKKEKDIAPIVRHLVQQVPLFNSNDIPLRTKVLTCLLVHPKIPNLLIKEYLAKGLTDSSPQVRINVLAAAKKFGIQFADNSGPMTAKCLADAVMGSILLSMVDKDTKVRDKARQAIRKLTYVMERKDAEIEAGYAAQHRSNPTSPQASLAPHTQTAQAPRSPSGTLAPSSQPAIASSTGFSSMDDWDNDDFEEASDSTSQDASITPSRPSTTSQEYSASPSSRSGTSTSTPTLALNKAAEQQQSKFSAPEDSNANTARHTSSSESPRTPKTSKPAGSWGKTWDAWGDEPDADEDDGLTGASETPLSRSKASFVATWEENDDFGIDSPKVSARAVAAAIARQPSSSSLSSSNQLTPKNSRSMTPSTSNQAISTLEFDDEAEEQDEIKVTRIEAPIAPVAPLDTPSKSFEMATDDTEALDAWGDDNDFDSDFDALQSKSTVPAVNAPLFDAISAETTTATPKEDEIADFSSPVDSTPAVSPVEEIPSDLTLSPQVEEPNPPHMEIEQEPTPSIEKSPSHFIPTETPDAGEEDMGDWGEDF